MTEELVVIPWPDPVLDASGFDPRSRYVELFWLPTIGPTCHVLLRHLADCADAGPSGGAARTRALPAERASATVDPSGGAARTRGLPEERASATDNTSGGAARTRALPAERASATEEDSAAHLRFKASVLAIQLGLGPRSSGGSGLAKAFRRLCQFELAVQEAPNRFHVRLHLPPLAARQVARLGPGAQSLHQAWFQGELAALAGERERSHARRIAFVLLEAGEVRDRVERRLQAAGFGPAVAHEAAEWAIARHSLALAAAQTPIDTPIGTPIETPCPV